MANKNTEDMKNYHHKFWSYGGRWQRTEWNPGYKSVIEEDGKVSWKLENAYNNEREMGYNVQCKMILFKL